MRSPAQLAALAKGRTTFRVRGLLANMMKVSAVDGLTQEESLAIRSARAILKAKLKRWV